METFVKSDSIVREIWSDTDCILFIFGASSGEFALHKSVDWLFFTGKLPSDPIGRLFSTVVYAQKIIFEEKNKAETTLEHMKNIHLGIENSRGYKIPNWAYQDVLYMLIAHTISAFELLHRALSEDEKYEIYDVFHRVGLKMGIENLPQTFAQWQFEREDHLVNNYHNSRHSLELFEAYKKHLGRWRFGILLNVQQRLLSNQLKTHIASFKVSDLSCLLYLYRLTKSLWPINQLKFYLLPKDYGKSLRSLGAKKC